MKLVCAQTGLQVDVADKHQADKLLASGIFRKPVGRPRKSEKANADSGNTTGSRDS